MCLFFHHIGNLLFSIHIVHCLKSISQRKALAKCSLGGMVQTNSVEKTAINKCAGKKVNKQQAHRIVIST